MRSILVLNSKGGSGKTTLATNLAGYYAVRGRRVTLVDFDPQRSSSRWLEVRDADAPAVAGVEVPRSGLRVPAESEIVVIDVPSGIRGRPLRNLLPVVQTVLVPVLPSPVDVYAVRELLAEIDGFGRLAARPVPLARSGIGRLREWLERYGPAPGPQRSPKMATVANRVRERTVASEGLGAFLAGLRLPQVASLRDSQNYVQAMARGLSLFELPPAQVRTDLHQWQSLLDWLDSPASRPRR